jgi:hypothetical protein
MEHIRNKIKKYLIIFTPVVLFGAQEQNQQKIDGVAAVVGDKVVLSSDVNQSLAMAVF